MNASGIIPSYERRRIFEIELQKKRDLLQKELEARYAEEFRQASWWQRIRIKSRIRSEVNKMLPQPPGKHFEDSNSI